MGWGLGCTCAVWPGSTQGGVGRSRVTDEAQRPPPTCLGAGLQQGDAPQSTPASVWGLGAARQPRQTWTSTPRGGQSPRLTLRGTQVPGQSTWGGSQGGALWGQAPGSGEGGVQGEGKASSRRTALFLLRSKFRRRRRRKFISLIILEVGHWLQALPQLRAIYLRTAQSRPPYGGPSSPAPPEGCPAPTQG